jgi:hypothetical protein
MARLETLLFCFARSLFWDLRPFSDGSSEKVLPLNEFVQMELL